MANRSESRLGVKSRAALSGKERLEKMSHDLRAPLNIIIGFTELLLAEVPGKINEEQRRSLKDILESSHRLLGLLQDYLEAPRTVTRKAISLIDSHVKKDTRG